MEKTYCVSNYERNDFQPENCVEKLSDINLDKLDAYPDIKSLLKSGKTVFASVAPSAVGQFGEASFGQLRTALKSLGFYDAVETALFADILTIKEGVMFNNTIKRHDDVFLTSCCCPIWFNMIKRNYPSCYSHLSPSVSPMIASGRILKELHKGCAVVFISPCLAKRAEIKEPDLIGSIDAVVSFSELAEIFKLMEIVPARMCSEDVDHASMGGRIYARSGGVSFSVKTVVNKLEPKRLIKLKPKKVCGIQNLKKILAELAEGKDIGANFVEGMGCEGGCIGGPKTQLPIEEAKKNVNDFGEDSLIMTPFDNLNVVSVCKSLGLESFEEIATNETMHRLLTRDKLENT